MAPSTCMPTLAILQPTAWRSQRRCWRISVLLPRPASTSMPGKAAAMCASATREPRLTWPKRHAASTAGAGCARAPDPRHDTRLFAGAGRGVAFVEQTLHFALVRDRSDLDAIAELGLGRIFHGGFRHERSEALQGARSPSARLDAWRSSSGPHKRYGQAGQQCSAHDYFHRYAPLAEEANSGPTVGARASLGGAGR